MRLRVENFLEWERVMKPQNEVGLIFVVTLEKAMKDHNIEQTRLMGKYSQD